MRFHTSPRRLLPALVVLAFAACNDEPENPFLDWEEEIDTVTLYSVDRPEHQGLPAAYDIMATRTVRIEDPGATGNWDFALTGGDGTPLTLTPLGAFFDVGNNAGLAARPEAVFDELDRAPSADDAYTTDEAVTVEEGVVYAIRSRQAGSCMNFGKLEPLEIDETEGTLTFQIMSNPRCNDTDLVPPED